MRTRLMLPLTVALLMAACDAGSTNGSETEPLDTVNSTPVATDGPAGPTTTAPEDAELVDALSCDPLDEHRCLLPWPNDAFTVPDASTPTGRRLALAASSTPTNAAGVNIGVTDINRADGFSPSSTILAFVPGLDVKATGLAGSTDVAASLDANSPVVLLDVTSGERLAYWAELDAQAPSGEEVLTIHPATSLREGHRVIVALGQMRDADGDLIPRSTGFEAALEGQPEPLERARSIREMLAILEGAGIDRTSLHLAWSFTVASSESLSGRLLHMRDTAYGLLGDQPPTFAVSSSVDNGTTRTIEGTIDVPNFLTGDGSPGSTFALDADGLPTLNAQNPTIAARFLCVVPTAPPTPVPAIVYGHGLLGSRSEAAGLATVAEQGIAAVCGTDWIGMSTEDIGNVASILADLGRFNEQADRMQQGHLNFQYLGRAINDPEGFVSDPAFQTADGTPVIAPGQTQFVGNSQGGILGGAASAISTEWSRVVLGVPGINYSLLLPRSSDWPQFQTIFDAAYTDAADRVLALQLIQLLWDRGENSGYVQHLTSDPYPGVEPKQVLMIGAFGDHQVANVSTYVLARTIGAAVHSPVATPPRGPSEVFGLSAITDYPFAGSALVMWDYGTPAPPPVNLPPSEPEFGRDPHGAGSSEPGVLQQAFTFLLTGEVTNPCGAAPCTGRQIDA